MGEKRAKLDSKFLLTNKKHAGGDEDQISQLPNDILLHIFSLLSLKEAGRTSVLSSRWINLWKHLPFLNLHADNELDVGDPDLVFKERYKYVRWVENILQSHKTPTLKELSIRFNLGRSFRKAIYGWLEIVFSRNIERLELDLSNHEYDKCYCFPDEFLTQSNACFNSLKALSFKDVSVSSEAINFFLRNCPLLEKLVVHGSRKLSGALEVCGPSLVLKHLEIVKCQKLKSVKVSAPSLTSLNVCVIEKLFLENVMMLVEVSVDYMRCNTLVDRLLGILPDEEEGKNDLYKVPKLPKLKKLIIDYTGQRNESFVGSTALIRESPYLEEFVLKVVLFNHYRRLNREVNEAAASNIRRFSHQHLKVFKFCGYNGRACEVELVKYVLENCIKLEKIIIDPRRKNVINDLPEVPAHVELIILK